MPCVFSKSTQTSRIIPTHKQVSCDHTFVPQQAWTQVECVWKISSWDFWFENGPSCHCRLRYEAQFHGYPALHHSAPHRWGQACPVPPTNYTPGKTISIVSVYATKAMRLMSSFSPGTPACGSSQRVALYVCSLTCLYSMPTLLHKLHTTIFFYQKRLFLHPPCCTSQTPPLCSSSFVPYS